MAGTTLDPNTSEPAARRGKPATFRLMRLRMTLALVTMALTPVLVMVALAPARDSALELERRAGLERAATGLSQQLGDDLVNAGEALTLATNDAAVRAYLGGDAGQEARAQRSLATLGSLLAGSADAVRLVDANGTTRSTVRAGRLVAETPADTADPVVRTALDTKAGSVSRSRPWERAPGEWVVSIAAPVTGGAGETAAGAIRADLPLADVLSRYTRHDGSWQHARLVRSADEVVLAETRHDAGAAEPIEGGATAAVPGARELTVWIHSDPVVSSATAGLASIVAAMIIPLVLVAFWMSRQVLRPALELEESRHKLTALYERARQDSLQDGLTGLGNHRAFQEEFDRQLEQSKRHGMPVSLVVLDIDDFKQVNDAAGHAVGDDLLQELGRLIAASLRRSDRAFRIGGDEFAIVMPHTEPDLARSVIRRLLATALEPRSDGDFRRPISFSAGISACPRFGSDRSELYAQADEAIYWGKRHGRTSVEIHDKTRRRPDGVVSSPEVSAAVAKVASERLIRPVFQPIIELNGGAVVGYEGLVRPKTDSGFSDPGALFSAAEASGRTGELDLACLDVVAGAAAAIGPDQLVSLNMSPRTMESPEFNVAVMLGILGKHRLSPTRVMLELTEREPVEDFDRLRENLAACQKAGIRIAADDVGAGNAGLRLLSQIHFDIVKIDLSLVQGGPVRESSMAVLRTLCDLAGRWGALIIAEGIETSQQLKVVRELKISAAQGYLLGRPAEAVDLQPLDLDALQKRDDMAQVLTRGLAGAAPAGLAVAG